MKHRNGPARRNWNGCWRIHGISVASIGVHLLGGKSVSHGDANEPTIRCDRHQNEERGKEISGSLQQRWQAGHRGSGLREHLIW